MALTVSIGVVAVLWRTPQGVYADPTGQLRALQQYVGGESPNFNTIVMPSPADLGRDAREWITWWPPGMGLLLLPLVSLGVSVVSAVRGLAVAAYVAGSVGWAFWLVRFRMPRVLMLTLAAALPLSHYATTPLFQYYTESFNWGCTPWVLLGALEVARRWEQRPTPLLPLASLLLGSSLGALYWLKYSAVFITGGVLLFLAWFCVDLWRRQRKIAALPLVAAAVPCAAILLALIAWNRSMGAAANSFAASRGFYLDWHNFLDAFSLFPLAMTDGQGLLDWLFFKPSHALIQNRNFISLAALPFGIALFWLIWRRRAVEPSLWLARCISISSAFGILAVWTLSGAGSHEPRHVAAGAITLLPTALQEFSFLRARWLRRALRFAGALILVVPLLYGAAAVAGKRPRARGYRPGPSGFYNPLLAASDAADVVRRLQPYASPDSIWYVTDGTTAMDLPGRIVNRHADFMPISALAAEQYRSSVPMRVNMLLPPTFEQNGKGAVIRASFPQAGQWTEITIEGAGYRLWTATLN